jgi:glycosyltransferase involved in cell wall biosynthesis
VEEAQCGLLVDPLNPKAIAEAIQWLLEHPAEAEGMGERGQKAVRERYKWDMEAKNLLTLYETLLN